MSHAVQKLIPASEHKFAVTFRNLFPDESIMGLVRRTALSVPTGVQHVAVTVEREHGVHRARVTAFREQLPKSVTVASHSDPLRAVSFALRDMQARLEFYAVPRSGPSEQATLPRVS